MPVSILNAGHGDSDPGAIANGLIERDINYKVATIAKELMEFNDITVPPIIRGSNLNEVIRQVNETHKKTPASIAHAIHHNAGKGDGSETIHSVNFGQATIFARILQEEFDKLGQNRHGSGFVTKLSSDGVHDYYGFIRHTDPSAVISEFAFLDTIDSKIIDTYEEQYAEAEAIAKAHCRFYGITYKKKSNASPLSPSPSPSVKVLYRVIIDNKQVIALSNQESAIAKVKELVDLSPTAKIGIVQRNTDNYTMFSYTKTVKQKQGKIIFYIYPDDECSAKFLSKHTGIKFVNVSEMTQEMFDNYETIYQVGGQKVNSNVTNYIAGNDMWDTLKLVLKEIGKLPR